MRQILIILCTVLLLPATTIAQTGISAFVGGGGNIQLSPSGITDNYNSEGFGFSVATGVNMHASERFDIQFLADYSHLFSDNDLGSDGFMGTIGVNGKFDIIQRKITPYIVGGYSLSIAYLPGATVNKQGFVSSENEREETMGAFRGGIGLDYQINEIIGVFFQSQYTLAVNRNKNFQYVPAFIGISYNFSR